MAAELPNLSDRQIRVYAGPTRDPELIALPLQTPAQLARSAARVRQIAAGLGQASVIPLWKAVQPGEPPIVTFEGDRALVAVGLARQTGPESFNRGSGVYVATPALLRYLGIDPATVDPSADFLADPTVPTDELVILTSGRGSDSPSRTSRGSTAGRSSALARATPAARRPPSSPSTVFAATAGSRSRAAGSSSRAAL